MAKRGIGILIECTPTELYLLVSEERSNDAYLAIKELIRKSQTCAEDG